MKRAEIEQLLPGIFRRTIRESSPLGALLDVMDGLHAPSEEILAGIDTVFSAYRTPDRFVPLLAQWLDLARLFDEHVDLADPLSAGRPPISSGLGRLRTLIAIAPQLSQWRGTKKGLLLFLQTATGMTGFRIDERQPFHLDVRAPTSAARHQPLIERILNLEKPAYVTYTLAFDVRSE